MRVFSFGGGVQSVAVLALAARGAVQYDAFVFANVGADSENPETLEYIDKFVRPFTWEHDIEFVVVEKMRAGQPDTVYQSVVRNNRSIPIPAYMPSRAPGNRSCTFDNKIKVVDSWVKLFGVAEAVIGVGISTDEARRMRSTEPQTHYRKEHPIGFIKSMEYPLIKLGLSRSACMREIEAAGLPIPPKSSCFFCPFHSPAAWIELKRNQPALFNRAVELEQIMNEKRARMGKDNLFLHSRCQPLAIATGDQLSLFEADCTNQCDSGYCHT